MSSTEVTRQLLSAALSFFNYALSKKYMEMMRFKVVDESAARRGCKTLHKSVRNDDLFHLELKLISKTQKT